MNDHIRLAILIITLMVVAVACFSFWMYTRLDKKYCDSEQKLLRFCDSLHKRIGDLEDKKGGSE